MDTVYTIHNVYMHKVTTTCTAYTTKATYTKYTRGFLACQCVFNWKPNKSISKYIRMLKDIPELIRPLAEYAHG